MMILTSLSRRLFRAVVAAAGFLMLSSASAQAPSVPAAIVLPARPSELLHADLAILRSILAVTESELSRRRVDWSGMSNAERIEWQIYTAILAQTRGQWAAAIDAVKQARALQTSESGRQTAGLLNQVLAERAMVKGDSAWLRRATRDAVLAMSWPDVEIPIKEMRQAMASMEEARVVRQAVNRWDASTAMTQGNASLAFLMQVLGARFQVQQVLPHRAALLLGLDDAIAQHSAPTRP